MAKLYIGIDNGTSGTIGILGEHNNIFIETPIIKEQSYTKKKEMISRVDINRLYEILMTVMQYEECEPSDCMVVMERPLINPQMFKTSISASRTLEAELCVVEMLSMPHMYIDSKQWQREILPQGIKGSPELKKASKDIGKRLFPIHESLIDKHKDADGILIAYWARKNHL